jgi:alpha-L-fucosidase
VKLHAIVSTLIVCATLGASPTAAWAWWQFSANTPSGQRQTSPHYDTLKECQKALKVAESALAKKYPDLYPLVGSCEEYR